MKQKMKLLLLCVLLCVSADVQHDSFRVIACSDTDGFNMMTLDGEEAWHADFIHETGVDTLPDFVSSKFSVGQQQVCKSNLKIIRIGLKDIPDPLDPPTSLLYTANVVELGEKNILVCHVSGFYPAPVNVSWTRNGDKVTEGTSINVPFPNEDNTFTQISRLHFVPQLGDIYSCSVEHLALKEPLTRIWDVEVQVAPPGVGPAVFCGVGLIVGLLGVAVGTFFLVRGTES
ncbi:LOW QUALITY PROTEIN: mamu class II histocompatibility antigen, DR alpha chain-like [Poeciliopsis prolifica]|uniref:LOW QUALITY PROTEIN: mamu class II histocompatibility antigen, DR alpha chain-like n=1 Tax=Poeciliopsis prolifica TaxID=188132 RepID=UPI00241444B2|nr:LOW QUALITY PROTEIN: mamu class II histocompatibility antigen, DR alpha chain-like [Poeciliopsis prolifica]